MERKAQIQNHLVSLFLKKPCQNAMGLTLRTGSFDFNNKFQNPFIHGYLNDILRANPVPIPQVVVRKNSGASQSIRANS